MNDYKQLVSSYLIGYLQKLKESYIKFHCSPNTNSYGTQFISSFPLRSRGHFRSRLSSNQEQTIANSWLRTRVQHRAASTKQAIQMEHRLEKCSGIYLFTRRSSIWFLSTCVQSSPIENYAVE